MSVDYMKSFKNIRNNFFKQNQNYDPTFINRTSGDAMSPCTEKQESESSPAWETKSIIFRELNIFLFHLPRSEHQDINKIYTNWLYLFP